MNRTLDELQSHKLLGNGVSHSHGQHVENGHPSVRDGEGVGEGRGVTGFLLDEGEGNDCYSVDLVLAKRGLVLDDHLQFTVLPVAKDAVGGSG